MIFPFRYKLTLIIIALIVSLLGGSFLLVQNELESRFTLRIQNDLVKTKHIVHALMRQRYQTLSRQSKTLQSDLLIREMLTDHSMDRHTRLDILNTELLPAYPTLDAFVLLTPDGENLAHNPRIKTALSALQQHPAMARILSGHTTPLYLLHNHHCLQFIGKPVFIREEMVGAILIGQRLSDRVVEKIKQLSGADLAFFEETAVFLSTQWSEHADTTQLAAAVLDASTTAADRLLLNQEPYIFRQIPASRFVPPYVLAKSLDKQLAFVQHMRNQIVLVALIGLALASVIAFLFSRSIAHPILLLTQATQAIDQENYEHRVDIHTRDEFTQLASAFNQMSQGLEERETLHVAMNQVVSREVTQALLDGKLNTLGETRHVSVIFTGMTNFAVWSSHFAPQADAAQTTLTHLNQYLTRVSFAIDSHRGNINQYIGEYVVGVFGNPIQHPEHGQDALQAAQTLLQAQQQFNQAHADIHAAEITTAIHSGEVITGYLGPQDRHHYAIVGEAFDTVQQCFHCAQHYHAQTVLTEQHLSTLSPRPRVRLLNRIAFAHHAQGLALYQLLPEHAVLATEAHLATYHNARELCLAQQWPAALTQFLALQAADEQDAVIRTWLQQVRCYQAHPARFEEDYDDGIALHLTLL